MENLSVNSHTMTTRSKIIQLICVSTQTEIHDKKRKFKTDYEEESDEEDEESDEEDEESEEEDEESDEEEEESYDEEEESYEEEGDEMSISRYTSKLTTAEFKYFIRLSSEEKQVIVENEAKISQQNMTFTPLRFKILSSKMDDYSKSVSIYKLDMLSKMESNNGEGIKIKNWITNLCKIPIGKYVSLPINNQSTQPEIYDFLEKTSTDFNKSIYGHTETKEQITRILAQWIANPMSKGNVIGIHGNPGVGKTTFVKDCICKSLNLPFQFIPLGGASDGSYLEGHSFTYEGSTWGKITDCLMKSNCMNPVLYFDELDKVSDTQKGQELINMLIHITDPSQNEMFYDKYFGDIALDLSKCLIIFTYNNDNLINPILKDRMIRIHTSDYSVKDKVEIMKTFMIPEFKSLFGFKNEDITFNEDILSYIIEKTDCEAGVRNLKRSLELIFSNINLIRMVKTKDYEGPIGKFISLNNHNNSILPINLTREIVDMYLKNKTIVNESYHHLYI